MRDITVGIAVHLQRSGAWPWVLDLAEGSGATVRAILVNDSFNRGALALAHGDVVLRIADDLRAIWRPEAESVEDRLRSEARQRGVKVVCERAEGRVVDCLLEEQEDSWLLAVGRGRSSLQHPGSLGMRVEQLVRRSPGAVLVTPLEYERPQRVVAAYAGKALGERVLELAVELAQALKAKLDVLSVGEDVRWRTEVQARARAVVERAGIDAGFLEKAGKPSLGITSSVSDRDLLVIGPSGGSKLQRMLLGSVTERVLRSVRCPVAIAAKA